MRRQLAFVLTLLASAAGAGAQNQVAPGRFIIDPPTLENLGFRWYIEGDDNRNAAVAVSYRKKGERAWKQSLPLLRVHRLTCLTSSAPTTSYSRT